MFFKHKTLFLIIQFIFCISLVYFINQQIILAGFVNNFFVELVIIYVLIIFTSQLLSKILTQIYIVFSNLIKYKVYRHFVSWMLFTIICYVLTFIVFAIAIEY